MTTAPSSAATIPALAGGCAIAARVRTFRAMATDVTVRIGAGAARPDDAIDAVAEVFALVERACTRFNPQSPLMRANAVGAGWYSVGPLCFSAVAEAARAHLRTDGLFDPRVLRSLTALGYDKSTSFGSGGVEMLPGVGAVGQPATNRWRPGLEPALHSVRIGSDPIDLGGIGKGLAVRWAAERILADCPSFYIEAGGDCYFGGGGPVGTGWRVGIENPTGGAGPVAVLNVADVACATSSTRVRNWTVAGRAAHHLIDPRTGEPSLGGLRSVTVLHPDPAHAEIWSKVLFLQGRAAIAEAATARDLAAVWVDDQGELGVSSAAKPSVLWKAT